MFKTAYEASGTLAAVLGSGSTLATVDFGLATYLGGVLDVGDWTYLRLASGGNVEVVKVTAVTGSALTITRAVDATGPYAFALGTELVYYLPQSGVIDIMDGNFTSGDVTITATGAATVTESPTNTFLIDVPVPTFEGEGGVVVTGDLASGYTVALESDGSGCCAGCGGGGGSGEGVQSVVGGGIASANTSSGVVTVTVQPPTFSGAGGLSVSGSWPNLLFTQGAASGVGTVTSVTTGAGLSYTGVATVAPTLFIANTGVVAGTYGGIAINARGQITAVPATLNPISIINDGLSVPGLTYARTADAVSLTPDEAAIGTPGIVELADHTDPLDENDETSAVTPALLAAVLNTLSGPSVQHYDSYTAEVIGTYSNVISTTNLTLALEAGEYAVVYGSVTMSDTVTPTNVVNFALALLDTSPAIVKANKTLPQCQQTIGTVIAGPSTATIRLATSAIPADCAVQSVNISAIKL